MRVLRLMAAISGLTLVGLTTAQAAPGFAMANVNLRSGPDTEYPSVGLIPEGAPVEVAGCLADESWCDVIWEQSRGWVFSEYIAAEHRGEMVPLPDIGIAEYRIPAVTFAAADYWQHYYVGRPWYAERARWTAYVPRARIGWRAPPAGPRVAGWWRTGYRAPVGMMVPPEHGWRRPEFRR